MSQNFSNQTIKQIEKSIERTAKGERNHITIILENQFWFPTTETNPDTETNPKMSAVEKRIYDELVKFKNLEAIQSLEKRRQENFSTRIQMERQRTL